MHLIEELNTYGNWYPVREKLIKIYIKTLMKLQTERHETKTKKKI